MTVFEEYLDELASLSELELQQAAEKLFAIEKQHTARVIAHLAEISRRKSYLELGHPSLFDYCTQRLGLDEGAAYLRMQVAGCCRRFPQILDALANNELSLTVAGRIAPHLTRDNVEELLAQSKGKSKRQVKELLVSLQPRPVVSSGMKRQAPPQPALVKGESRSAPGLMPLEPSENPTVPEPSGTGRGSIEPARRHVYNIRFSAEEAFKKKFERLAEVLGVHNPHRQMATLLEKALDIALEKKDPQQRLERRERRARAQKSSPRPAKEKAGHRSRAVPADVRDRVLSESGYQCEYRGSDGNRCRARTGLQVDHRLARGRGGSDDEPNLRALCAAHNLRCAEKDFGVEFVRNKIREARSSGKGSSDSVISSPCSSSIETVPGPKDSE